MASAYGWGAAVLAGVGLFCFACGGDDDKAGTPSNPDGGILDSSVQNESDGEAAAPGGPQTITIKATVAPTSLSPAGPANATIAAVLGDDGKTWTALTPTSTGVYTVTTTLARWTAVFICSDDNDNTQVDVYERAASIGNLDVKLGPPCALPQVLVSDLSGQFTNMPATTDWLDFAYAFDDRESPPESSGATSAYDIPNIQRGTWDLIFGLRDNDGEPLTKVYIARQQNLAADLVLNADVSVVGFAPTPHTITVNGATADESLSASVLYALNSGTHGVDFGPQQSSAKGATSLTYGTVPTASQQASDFYLATIETESLKISDTQSTQRGFEGAFHTAIDFPLTLPAAIPSMSVSVGTSTPYVRVAFKTVGRAAATSYGFTTLTHVTDQVSHNWNYTTDQAYADGAEIDLTMPDLTGVQGFKATWAPDPTETDVAVTANEKPVTISDGTLTPFATLDGPLPQ